MPPPTSPDDQRMAGSFSCLLCDAGGFSAVGMQLHIQMCHSNGSNNSNESKFHCVICDYVTESADDHLSHVDKEHNGARSFPCQSSIPNMKDGEKCITEKHAEKSQFSTKYGQNVEEDAIFEDIKDISEDDSWEEDGPNMFTAESKTEKTNDKVLVKSFSDMCKESCSFDGSKDTSGKSETDLQLKDCPAENHSCTAQSHTNDNGTIDTGSVSDMDMDEKLSSDGENSDEESNLAVILGITRNGDHALKLKSDNTVNRTANDPADTNQRTEANITSSEMAPSSTGDMKKLPVPSDSDFLPSTSWELSEERTNCETERLEESMDERIYRCPFCSYQTLFEPEIQFHVSKVHKEEEELLFSCPFCDDSFPLPDDLSRHLNWRHTVREISGTNSQEWPALPKSLVPENIDSRTADNPDEDGHRGAKPKVKSTETTSSPTASLTKLPDSGFLLSTSWGQSHDSAYCKRLKDSMDERTYSCPFCSFRTYFEPEIQFHVSEAHKEDMNQESLFSCHFCGDSFPLPTDLSQHISSKHSGGEIGGVASRDQPVFSDSVSRPNSREASMQQTPELKCPVCGLVLKGGNELLLSAHVERHFASLSDSADRDHQLALKLQDEEHQRQLAENRQCQALQAQYGMDSRMTANKQFEKDLEHAVYNGKMTTSEFHQRKISRAQSKHTGVDDGSTEAPGILEPIRQFYDSRACPRTVAQVYLCSSTCHYSSSYGDKGWGCGYRNFQMLLSCLMNDPTYLHVLFNGKAKIPSIQKLQQLIESAWKKGFDCQGCKQLGGSVINSRKWIGATEIVATLSSLKIKCRLLDFSAPSGPDNTHPNMIRWVRDYFKSSKGFTPPLYLQHHGHSRTIVGVEELRNGNTNLLLFDPGVPRDHMLQFHNKINYNLMQTVRKTIKAFHAKQYQVVAVVGFLDDTEQEQSKRIRSTQMS